MTISEAPRAPTRARVLFALATLVVGVLDVAFNPVSLNPDGVAYIDVGRALLDGHRYGVTGYWSPLYSMYIAAMLDLSGAGSLAEVVVVRTANLGVLAVAAMAFEWMVTVIVARVRVRDPGMREWIWRSSSYTVFLWTCYRNIGIAEITPDLAVAASIFSATALMLSYAASRNPVRRDIVLGVVLACGYLAKAVMFVVAWPLLAVFAWRSGLKPGARATAVFLLVSAPWILVLSSVKHRPTFGDVGRLNVVWYNSEIRPYMHWQGDEPGTGTPIHATRRVMRNPEVFEFASPFPVTYPPWYDASYWYEGVNSKVPIVPMVRAAVSRLKGTSPHLWPLVLGVFLLLAFTRDVPRPSRAEVRDIAPFFVPALLVYVIYAPIAMYTRYLAAAAALLYLGVFYVWARSSPPNGRRVEIVFGVVAVILIGQSLAVLSLRAQETLSFGRILRWRDGDDQSVAQLLSAVYPGGTPVASIGTPGAYLYWPHLAGFREVAESPNYNDRSFWASPDSVKAQALCALSRAGATFVVADSLPHPLDAKWARVGGGRFAFRRLKGSCPDSTALPKKP